jgi:CO/xanthine dehydrogenase Mo-binding subunit
MAGGWYGIARTAAVDRAGTWVEIDDGGTVKVVTGVTEIGEGILTVLAQIAAEEIGVRPEDVVIGDNVADMWKVEPEKIQTGNGYVWAVETNFRESMAEAVEHIKKRGVVPVGSANFTAHHTGLNPVDGSGTPWQAYVFGCQVAEVEVDTVTGEVQVLGVWAAHDVGRAVNPRGVEGQIEGGVVQALGQGLMEDYKLAQGHTTTPGFAKYILPTSLDVPHVTSIIVEDRDPIGPLGVKGIGEPAMVPTIPAVMNAVYDAIGIRITSLPASPERILEALAKKRNSQISEITRHS